MNFWDAWDRVLRSRAGRAANRDTRTRPERRSDRGEPVAVPRREVRRLQSAIAEPDRSPAVGAPGVRATLVRDLDRAPRELARCQARI